MLTNVATWYSYLRQIVCSFTEAIFCLSNLYLFLFQQTFACQIRVVMEERVKWMVHYLNALAKPIILAQHVKHVCSILLFIYLTKCCQKCLEWGRPKGGKKYPLSSCEWCLAIHYPFIFLVLLKVNTLYCTHQTFVRQENIAHQIPLSVLLCRSITLFPVQFSNGHKGFWRVYNINQFIWYSPCEKVTAS